MPRPKENILIKCWDCGGPQVIDVPHFLDSEGCVIPPPCKRCRFFRKYPRYRQVESMVSQSDGRRRNLSRKQASLNSLGGPIPSLTATSPVYCTYVAPIDRKILRQLVHDYQEFIPLFGYSSARQTPTDMV